MACGANRPGRRNPPVRRAPGRGFQHIIDVHRHLQISDEQRERFVALYMEAPDEAGRRTVPPGSPRTRRVWRPRRPTELMGRNRRRPAPDSRSAALAVADTTAVRGTAASSHHRIGIRRVAGARGVRQAAPLRESPRAERPDRSGGLWARADRRYMRRTFWTLSRAGRSNERRLAQPPRHCSRGAQLWSHQMPAERGKRNVCRHRGDRGRACRTRAEEMGRRPGEETRAAFRARRRGAS